MIPAPPRPPAPSTVIRRAYHGAGRGVAGTQRRVLRAALAGMAAEFRSLAWILRPGRFPPAPLESRRAGTPRWVPAGRYLPELTLVFSLGMGFVFFGLAGIFAASWPGAMPWCASWSPPPSAASSSAVCCPRRRTRAARAHQLDQPDRHIPVAADHAGAQTAPTRGSPSACRVS